MGLAQDDTVAEIQGNAFAGSYGHMVDKDGIGGAEYVQLEHIAVDLSACHLYVDGAAAHRGVIIDGDVGIAHGVGVEPADDVGAGREAEFLVEPSGTQKNQFPAVSLEETRVDCDGLSPCLIFCAPFAAGAHEDVLSGLGWNFMMDVAAMEAALDCGGFPFLVVSAVFARGLEGIVGNLLGGRRRIEVRMYGTLCGRGRGYYQGYLPSAVGAAQFVAARPGGTFYLYNTAASGVFTLQLYDRRGFLHKDVR